MVSRQTIFSEYYSALDQRELELIGQKKATAAFVTTPHTIQDTQKHIDELRKAEFKLAEVMEALASAKTTDEYRREANKLCARGNRINEHARDISRMLVEDVLIMKAAGHGEAVDVLKSATFLVAIPGALITAVKGGIASSCLDPYQAGILGLLISSGILLRKRLHRSFRAAGRDLCSIPKEICQSFTVYYIRETIREKWQATALFLSEKREALTRATAPAVRMIISNTEKPEL